MIIPGEAIPGESIPGEAISGGAITLVAIPAEAISGETGMVGHSPMAGLARRVLDGAWGVGTPQRPPPLPDRQPPTTAPPRMVTGSVLRGRYATYMYIHIHIHTYMGSGNPTAAALTA